MTEKIAEITFTTQLVREYSSLPKVDDLGAHESTMTLYFNKDATGFIEWEIPDLYDGAEIGLWFDLDRDGKRTLADYDGIMSLPKEAIQLMRDNGVTVTEDFE